MLKRQHLGVAKPLPITASLFVHSHLLWFVNFYSPIGPYSFFKIYLVVILYIRTPETCSLSDYLYADSHCSRESDNMLEENAFQLQQYQERCAQCASSCAYSHYHQQEYFLMICSCQALKSMAVVLLQAATSSNLCLSLLYYNCTIAFFFFFNSHSSTLALFFWPSPQTGRWLLYLLHQTCSTG